MSLSMQIQVPVHDPAASFLGFDGGGLKADLRKAVGVQDLRTLHRLLNLCAFVLRLFRIENAHPPHIDTHFDAGAREVLLLRLIQSEHLSHGCERSRRIDPSCRRVSSVWNEMRRSSAHWVLPRCY